MKIASLFLFLHLGLAACHAQPQSWPTTKSWKVYASSGPEVFKVPVDSLPAIPSKLLDRDTVQFYLSKMQIVPDDRKPTWMGAWLASYESADGKLRKVEIGAYGGYFYDVSSEKYYSLPRNLILRWQRFISANIPE